MINGQTTQTNKKVRPKMDAKRLAKIREAQEQTLADEIGMDETFGFFSPSPGTPEAFEQELIYAVHMHTYGY